MAAGIPILQEWYSFGVRNGTTGKVRREEHNNGLFYQATIQRRGGALCRVESIHPETRCSFAAAFGIDVPTQLVLEEYIAGASFSGHIVSKDTEHYSEPSRQFEYLKALS